MKLKIILGKILLTFIIFQTLVIIYLFINNSNTQTNVHYLEWFERKDTVEILKQLLINEKSLNRHGCNSGKPLYIIKNPFLNDDYSSDLRIENTYFTNETILTAYKGKLNFWKFKLNKNNIAVVEYNIGLNFKGKIWLKKDKDWKTIRFEHWEE